MKFKVKYLLLSAIILTIIIPLIMIFNKVFTENSEYLKILVRNGILFDYLITTFELIFKVMIFSIIIGFIPAYINTFYDYRFKKVINVLLILPLAIPVYVGAYTYELIYYEFGLLELLFKNSFTLNGSVFIYTIFLYPYVYLASRSYLKRNLLDYVEASKTLGVSNIYTFMRIIFPLSWPAVLGSSLFVVFETLSDFAVVDYYGVETVSKIIKDSWRIGQYNTSAKVSMVLLFFLFIIVLSEKVIRKRKRYTGLSDRVIIPKKLNTNKSFIVYPFLIIIISLGLFLPLREMIKNAIIKYQYFDSEMISIFFNTLLTIVITLIIILIVGMIYASIINSLKKNKDFLGTFGVIGYSIPSLILAIGVYFFAIVIDKWLIDIGLNVRIFTGTRLALVIGLSIKFLSMAYTSYSNTLGKVNRNILESSKVLGNSSFKTFFKVNLPLLKHATPAVIIIIFIDLIKELTLTYSLRPFNFKTLSTEVYRYAGNEMIEVAAIPSLLIIVCSVILIIYMEVGMKNAKN